MQPDTDDNLTIATLGRQLEGIQSGKPILFEGFLTAIFPVADTNAMELILQKLRHFLKETGNAGAISDLFDGFYRTATYYSQARLTLSLSSHQLGCLYTYGEYASGFCFPSPPSNIWNIKTAEPLIKKKDRSPEQSFRPHKNFISFSVSPQAGAVGPACCRSQARSISPIFSGGYCSLPISIRVPAIMRTMLYKKPRPRT